MVSNVHNACVLVSNGIVKLLDATMLVRRHYLSLIRCPGQPSPPRWIAAFKSEATVFS